LRLLLLQGLLLLRQELGLLRNAAVAADGQVEHLLHIDGALLHHVRRRLIHVAQGGGVC
jgi:hypothetical protein